MVTLLAFEPRSRLWRCLQIVVLATSAASLAGDMADGADGEASSIWDFIVVGAGTGGALCAGRLSDTGASVLLLEAGHWDDVDLYKTAGSGKHRNRAENIWAYPTQLPGHLEMQNDPDMRKRITSGKLVGGSSSIHGDVYDRPPFKEFEYRGMPTWSEAKVRAAYKRIEEDMKLTWVGHASLDDVPDPHYIVVSKLMDGLNLPHHPKQNLAGGKGGISAGWWLYRSCSTLETSASAACRRHTSYTDFVATRNTTREESKPPITILSDALVSRVLLEDGEAVGVEVKRNLRWHKAFARRAVILAAGAIGTPKLLTLSGVGDPLELQRLGVPVKVANREVGQGLADHLAHFTWFMILASKELIMDNVSCQDKEAFNAFFNITAGGDPAVAEAGLDNGAVDAEVRFFTGCNKSRNTFDFGIETVLLNPNSRGRVVLPSRQPETLPIVEYPPLWERDYEQLEAIHAQLAAAFQLEPKELSSVRGLSLLESIKKNAYLYQHLCCSARAARDGEPGVCDEQLRVRGVRGLYIADASALPFLPSAHSSSAVLFVAEEAATHASAHTAPRPVPAHLAAVAASESVGMTPRAALISAEPYLDAKTAPLVPTVRLAQADIAAQVEMPRIALGTGTISKSRVEGAVASFLQFGGRHLDTAAMYDNYAAMRRGIEASGLQDLSEVFVTTKIMPLGADHVRRELGIAIKELGVRQIDVVLLHWPGDITSGKLLHGASLPGCAEPDDYDAAKALPPVERGLGAALTPERGTVWRKCREESYAALLEEQAAGRARAVGVSNFAARHLNELASLGYAPPAVHQLEWHPYWHDDAILERHTLEGGQVQAYGCLGGKHTGAFLVQNQGITKIADRNNRSTAQVILRWALQSGVTVVTGGSSDGHIQENLAIADFELEEEDMNFIGSIHPDVMQKMYGPHPEEIL